MNIKIERITKEKIDKTVCFLSEEAIKLYLEIRPQLKKLYDGNSHELINSFFFDSFKEQINENSKVYIALLDEEIIGAGFIDDTNYLNSLFIKTDYRNKGIGSNILKKIIKLCSENSIIRVDAKIEAIPFYQKFNFHLSEVQEDRHLAVMELERGHYEK